METANGELRFPILESSRRQTPGKPRSVPWAFVAPHEKQAIANHSQTLRRLAERGGLGWCELENVLLGRAWNGRAFQLPKEQDAYAAYEAAAAERVLVLLAAFASRPAPRPKLRPDGIPSRIDQALMTPAELAITAAMAAVEAAGASEALTDAVTLLAKARGRVADHVEAEI